MEKKLTPGKKRHIVVVMQTLDELLEEWRIKNGYSYTEAAAVCGISPSMWTRIRKRERVRLGFESLMLISHGTGYTTDTLSAAAQRSLEVMANPAEVVKGASA